MGWSRAADALVSLLEAHQETMVGEGKLASRYWNNGLVGNQSGMLTYAEAVKGTSTATADEGSGAQSRTQCLVEALQCWLKVMELELAMLQSLLKTGLADLIEQFQTSLTMGTDQAEVVGTGVASEKHAGLPEERREGSDLNVDPRVGATRSLDICREYSIANLIFNSNWT